MVFQLKSRQTTTFLQYHQESSVVTNRKWSLEAVLTAVFRSKLPQVKILHGEVHEGGQFAGSSCL